MVTLFLTFQPQLLEPSPSETMMNEQPQFFRSRLSGLLLFWLSFIMFNTFLGRQVHILLLSVGGRMLIITAITLVAVATLVFFTREVIKAGVSFKVGKLLILLSLAMVAAWFMPIAEERMHIVKYGGLGFLVQLLAHKQVLPNWLSLVIAFTVSILDEAIQHFLPYRVGDLRDVGFNIASCIWGIALVVFCVRPERG